jgi:hypothetical protein
VDKRALSTSGVATQQKSNSNTSKHPRASPRSIQWIL